jgi:hypothetical protein
MRGGKYLRVCRDTGDRDQDHPNGKVSFEWGAKEDAGVFTQQDHPRILAHLLHAQLEQCLLEDLNHDEV